MMLRREQRKEAQQGAARWSGTHTVESVLLPERMTWKGRPKTTVSLIGIDAVRMMQSPADTSDTAVDRPLSPATTCDGLTQAGSEALTPRSGKKATRSKMPICLVGEILMMSLRDCFEEVDKISPSWLSQD